MDGCPSISREFVCARCQKYGLADLTRRSLDGSLVAIAAQGDSHHGQAGANLREEVKDATVVLKNGRTARVTMHLIEGSKEEIEATFHESIQAFFEMYPEI